MELEPDLYQADYGELILYKTSLKKFDLTISKLPKDSTTKIPEDTELQINANFFDSEFKPLGLILENGKVLNKAHLGGNVLTGILIKKNGLLGIKHRDQLPSLDLSNLELALQAGPRIIAKGSALQQKNSNFAERRSGLCLDQQRQLIIYITKTTSVVSFEDLQKILLSKDISCRDALNLDGGSSTQYSFYQAGKLQDTVIGFSSVPIFLRLITKFD